MAAGKGKRWGRIALPVLVALIAGGIVGFRAGDSRSLRLACSKGSFPEREFC
jgi:hypothetical protein